MDFSALKNFGPAFSGVASYAWVLWIFVPLAILILGVYIYKVYKDKNKQWTHKLRVRRVMQNGFLSSEDVINMRRFPLIKRAEVFELERPLLGGYLMPELDSYTGTNEFSIIIDKNNRIYKNTGDKFCPDKASVMVSAKHAEIDISRADLRADYQNVNKTSKRIEWSKIAKAMMFSLLIIAVMIVAIKGIGQWGENHKIDAQKAAAEAEAFANLADALKTSQATTNAQIILTEMMKEQTGNNNIQQELEEIKKKYSEVLNETV